MKKDPRSIQETIKTSLLFVPVLVIMGSFYSNGQASVFGDVYFSSIGYQDTLVQLFVSLRTLVFLTAIGILLLMLALFCLIAFSFFNTSINIVSYKIGQTKAKLIYIANKANRDAEIKSINEQGDLLARNDTVSKKEIDDLARHYSNARRLDDLELSGVRMYDDFIAVMASFLKRRPLSPNGDEHKVDGIQQLKTWLESMDQNFLSGLFYVFLTICSALALLFIKIRTDTIFLSFLFLIIVFFLITMLKIANWFYRSKTKQGGFAMKILDALFVFCLVAIFMFTLGRDEAQSAKINAEYYSVYGTDAIFSGRLLASNHSGILLLEETEVSYIRWSTVQYLELNSNQN